MATKRLPGQFDILTICVITTAVAVTCALVRFPLRLDVKILAISTELSVFLVWALWYYEELRTSFPATLGLLHWSLVLGMGMYLYSLPASGRTSLTISILPLGLIVLSGVMLLWQIRKIYKMKRGGANDTDSAESGVTSAARTRQTNPGRVAVILALPVLMVFASGVWFRYRNRGYYEFSSSDIQFGILFLVVMVFPFLISNQSSQKWSTHGQMISACPARTGMRRMVRCAA